MKYIQLLRVSHYLKNLYIFLPVFFSGNLFSFPLIIKSFYAFMAFSLVASSIYIFNDIMDIEEDKNHPKKKNRPIPSGQISLIQCYIFIALLLASSLTISWFVSLPLLYIIAGYFAMNILYSIKLKHIAIIDILIISIGFILRVESGGAVTAIELSKWLIIMVFLLSMFQALAKRMEDIMLTENNNFQVRKSIDGYNLDFLKVALSVLSSVLIVCYLMYITSDEIVKRLGSYSYYTALPVLIGILRYLQLCYVYNKGASPVTILIKDHFIKIVILIWLIAFAGLLNYNIK